jgi:hypothetical protein
VTATTITVSFRLTKELAHPQAPLTPANASATEATIRTLAAYFNQHFQFYGRQLNVVFYTGAGTLEETGSTTRQAEADASTIADKLRAFADLSAYTEPYADALISNKMLALGEVGLPESWYQQHQPYAWSDGPSGLQCQPLQIPVAQTIGYAAFKTETTSEPVPYVDYFYAQMDQLAIGISMAGSDLTPASFAAGLVKFPAHDGPHGLWKFSSSEHSPSSCPQ